jgi:prephenate dehydrogenase
MKQMGRSPLFETVAIVGVGLIGGSLARAARERGLVSTIIGLGRGEQNLRRALELGVIDVLEKDLERGIRRADLIVLATPVCTLPGLLPKIAPFRKPESFVTDVGSVKAPILQEADRIFRTPSPFVGGHPIAGTEHSGVEASHGSLFEQRRCILTPGESTDPRAQESVLRLWESVGSEVVIMDAERHDQIMGFISHLPHIVAYGLVHAVQLAEARGEDLSSFSAGGFRDFTRIASSHPEMWRDICLMNSGAILDAMGAFEKSFREIRQLILEQDGQGLEKVFRSSRQTRAEFLKQKP